MKHKLILGTVQLGLDYGINNMIGKPSLEKAFDILHTAYDYGVKTLDTAEAYGDSQKVIGVFHKNNPKKEFKIISKLDPRLVVESNSFISHIEQTCSILNIEKLFGYMFHSYNSFIDNQKNLNKLLLAKQKGFIEKLGISVYSNTEVEQVINGDFKFDFIQLPFNLLDNATKRKELIEEARSKSIEVHTRSVFLQGLFFKNIDSLSKKMRDIYPYLTQIKNLAKQNNIGILDLALNYVLQKEYIDNVLIGVETREQLIKNIHSHMTMKNVPHDAIDTISVARDELLNPSNWN